MYGVGERSGVQQGSLAIGGCAGWVVLWREVVGPREGQLKRLAGEECCRAWR